MMDKSMWVEIALYLRGSALDPQHITRALALQPTRSQSSGETRTTPSAAEYRTRIGMWVLSVRSDSPSIEEAIANFLAKIPTKLPCLSEMVGVEDAYVDIFIAVDSDEDGGGTCEFQLKHDKIEALNRLGVPVRFTVSVVKP